MIVSTLFDDRIEGGENLGGMELFLRWGGRWLCDFSSQLNN